MRADEEYMVSLWQHEILRVVKDRICRSVDMQWFDKTLKAVIKEVKVISRNQMKLFSEFLVYHFKLKFLISTVKMLC